MGLLHSRAGLYTNIHSIFINLVLNLLQQTTIHHASFLHLLVLYHWDALFLLVESRPFEFGRALGALEGLTGTDFESSANEYSSNPSTSGQGLVRRGKRTVTSQGSDFVGGGSGGSFGSSGGGQTVNSGGSAKPGGSTESGYMPEDAPETEICRRGKQTNTIGGSIKNGGGSVGDSGSSGSGGQTATSAGSTTNGGAPKSHHMPEEMPETEC
ncbi:hypothetical protein EDD18DRAFT_1462581 [Armillaria luteobubalina]|uniref:Uncharacterized protein n=1 Tax=Armillaria luteobubalina TaxID=153913 RepID=A0AA39Q823_9AGAR|nr:hypothetical protein EDD18DRAFT_1462581 [Armillaria luteobubalina]